MAAITGQYKSLIPEPWDTDAYGGFKTDGNLNAHVLGDPALSPLSKTKVQLGGSQLHGQAHRSLDSRFGNSQTKAYY